VHFAARTVSDSKFIQVFRGKLTKETVCDLTCSWRGTACDCVLFGEIYGSEAERNECNLRFFQK
jgi:hypothetical protein